MCSQAAFVEEESVVPLSDGVLQDSTLSTALNTTSISSGRHEKSLARGLGPVAKPARAATRALAAAGASAAAKPPMVGPHRAHTPPSSVEVAALWLSTPVHVPNGLTCCKRYACCRLLCQAFSLAVIAHRIGRALL